MQGKRPQSPDGAEPARLAERCFLCRTSKAVCYWPVRRAYSPRRRIALFFASLLILLLPGGFFYLLATQPVLLLAQTGWWLLLGLSIIGTAMSLMGIAASLWGCNGCVVRMFGTL